MTSTPQPSDLTPPTGPFPLSRSQSPITILHHLLSEPTPTIEHSREVILEYVLNRESKARERKPGRGGKGTLGRDSFEDISKRLGEIEDGLMRSSQNKQLSLEDLDEPRQLGMALVLSLRMSLSYFTFQELADQLLQIPISVAEKVLVQHIRRRVEGEGRWGVGKELEYIESLVSPSINRIARPLTLRSSRSDLPSSLHSGLRKLEHYFLPSPFTRSPFLRRASLPASNCSSIMEQLLPQHPLRQSDISLAEHPAMSVHLVLARPPPLCPLHPPPPKRKLSLLTPRSC